MEKKYKQRLFNQSINRWITWGCADFEAKTGCADFAAYPRTRCLYQCGGHTSFYTQHWTMILLSFAGDHQYAPAAWPVGTSDEIHRPVQRHEKEGLVTEGAGRSERKFFFKLIISHFLRWTRFPENPKNSNLKTILKKMKKVSKISKIFLKNLKKNLNFFKFFSNFFSNFFKCFFKKIQNIFQRI